MKNRSFIAKDDIAVACEISGTSRVDSDRTLFARNTMMRLQAQGRAAPMWIAATVVATSWTTQLQVSSDQSRYASADKQRAMKARMEGATSVGQDFPHGGSAAPSKPGKELADEPVY
jgi:hypothetical protein